jgi:hypothetical protein
VTFLGMRYVSAIRSVSKWRLHPLIYTLLKSNLAQDVEKKKAELKLRSVLSLNQDIVPLSQEQKWGLKYVIYIFSRLVENLDGNAKKAGQKSCLF